MSVAKPVVVQTLSGCESDVACIAAVGLSFHVDVRVIVQFTFLFEAFAARFAL